MSDNRTMTDPDRAVEPLQADKSLGQLFGDLTTDLSRLFRAAAALAKTEARDELKKTGKGTGMLGGAGLAGWMTAPFVSFALAWLLDLPIIPALAVFPV